MILRTPRSNLTDTLFTYTTRFRSVERRREDYHRGDAALQQLRHGHPHAGRQALGVVLEDRQELVQRGVVEAGAADLVGDALAQRLAGRVAVEVDHPRPHPQVAAADSTRPLARAAPPHLGATAAAQRPAAAPAAQ